MIEHSQIDFNPNQLRIQNKEENINSIPNEITTTEIKSVELQKRIRKISTRSKTFKKQKNNNDNKKNKMIQSQQQKQQQQQQQVQKLSWIYIEYPLKDKGIFHLTGHILTEIYPENNLNVEINIMSVEQQKNHIIIHPHFEESITQFDSIIYMLQNSQSITLYQTGEILKIYQQLVFNQLSQLQQIKSNESYNTIEELQQLRQEFKNDYINFYLKNNYNEDDFYLVINVGINLEQNCSNTKNIRFSKSYFALIGIDEDIFNNKYFRKYLLFLVLPHKSRQKFFLQFVQSYINKQNYFDEILIKNFEFLTIDEILIVCDVKYKFIEIPYPERLQNKELDQLHLLMDNITIIQFDIQDYHIKNILNQRQPRQELNHEDFEYSVFTEMFLLKHYPLKLLEFQKLKQDNDGVIDDERQQLDDSKRCSFRYIK